MGTLGMCNFVNKALKGTASPSSSPSLAHVLPIRGAPGLKSFSASRFSSKLLVMKDTSASTAFERTAT